VEVSESKPENSGHALDRLLRVPLTTLQKEIAPRQAFLLPFRAASVADHLIEGIYSFIPEARLEEACV